MYTLIQPHNTSNTKGTRSYTNTTIPAFVVKSRFRKSYKKIKQKGRSVNSNVAFQQAKALTMKTLIFYGREATIIVLRTLVPFLILTNQ